MGPLLSVPKTKCSHQDSCIWADHSSVDLQSCCQFSILLVLKGNTIKLDNSPPFSDWERVTVCVLQTERVCCKINSGDPLVLEVEVRQQRLPVACRSFGIEEIPVVSNPTFLCIPCHCCQTSCPPPLKKTPKKKSYHILLAPP